MKLFQSLSTMLLSIIVFAAYSNNASAKEISDTTAAPGATVNTNVSQQDLEANKKIVTDFVQLLYGDKDSTAIEKYIANNVKQHNPLLQDGKQWLKDGLRPYLQNPNIKKVKVDIRQIAAEGDKVWTLIREVAPNGNVFARAEIFRIENGKIAELWLVSQAEPRTSANKNTMF